MIPIFYRLQVSNRDQRVPHSFCTRDFLTRTFAAVIDKKSSLEFSQRSTTPA
jgi:hypothetical protein